MATERGTAPAFAAFCCSPGRLNSLRASWASLPSAAIAPPLGKAGDSLALEHILCIWNIPNSVPAKGFCNSVPCYDFFSNGCRRLGTLRAFELSSGFASIFPLSFILLAKANAQMVLSHSPPLAPSLKDGAATSPQT